MRHFSLPAPRPLVRPILWIYLAINTAYGFLFRVLICEPLFKAYCTHYGRRLHTGVFIHWVQGAGDLVVGDDVLVDGKCGFSFAARYVDRPTLSIGHGTIVSHGCSFTVAKSITIGERCILSTNTWITDSSGHPADPADRLAGLAPAADKIRPVTIEDNVWIGTHCIVLPGSHIGEGSVISALSVVRGEIPPYTVAAGNPARPVASLRRPDGEPKAGPSLGTAP